jgi:hypothetical protein
VQRGFGHTTLSPDLMLVVLSSSSGEPTLALAEFKSKCSASTEVQERQITSQVGAFVYVAVGIEQASSILHCAIPEAQNRCQIIHDVCCARIKDAFFEIIPVVHVRVDDEFKVICMNSMKKQ